MKRPPVGWVGGTRRFVLLDFRLVLRFHPISLVLPKETGWSPKEKRLGWWRPREVSGPARLSHSRGRCHSAAEVSAPRTIAIWALRAAGMVKTPRRGVFLFQYGVRGKPTFGRGWMTAHITAVRMRLRAAGAARKGGTPGEGPPFDPLLRFFSTRRVPRAAARVHGLRPRPPPAFL